MSKPTNPPTTETPQGGSARLWAAERLTQVAEQFPGIEPPDIDLSGLSPADASLALAIYRTTVQRWFTLQHLLELFLSKKVRLLEPPMQAVLMSGAAQLVFLDRLPAYAVVDESVGLARKVVRPEAAGMVNAVLRKLDRLVSKAKRVEAWSPDSRLVPLPDGGAIQLPEGILPDPSPLDKHLVVATSLPLRLVREWIQRWGNEGATKLCIHALSNAPTVIWVERDFKSSSTSTDALVVEHGHRKGRFVVWVNQRACLRTFLTEHPERRVQDVSASLAVLSTEGYKVKSILDYCAGKGTKTRQLALAHPDAQVVATDTHPGRRKLLREAVAGLDNVTVVEPDQAGDMRYDLVVLDVPCTNTGVLARRPEARYRFSQQSLGQLVKLQREIVDRAVAWVKDDGMLLYTTCSIEPPENQKQIARLVKHGAEMLHDHQEMPSGFGDKYEPIFTQTYTDGSYHALVAFNRPGV